MRTIFPPNTGAGHPPKPLKRALLLSGLLVVVWIAITLLPAGDGWTPSATTAEAVDAAESADGSLLSPGYFLVLLLLGVGAVWAFWLRREREGGTSSGPDLRVVSRLRTGPQQHLHLIECGDEILLLGATPTQINLIKAYPAALFEQEAPVAAMMMDMDEPETRQAEPSQVAVNGGGIAPEDAPEWSVTAGSMLENGPDFMTVLRRYAGAKSYRANTLHPPSPGDPS